MNSNFADYYLKFKNRRRTEAPLKVETAIPNEADMWVIICMAYKDTTSTRNVILDLITCINMSHYTLIGPSRVLTGDDGVGGRFTQGLIYFAFIVSVNRKKSPTMGLI